MTLTNRYVEIGQFGRYHLTLSVTQFAFGFALLTGDNPGEWVVILGPLILSPIQDPR